MIRLRAGRWIAVSWREFRRPLWDELAPRERGIAQRAFGLCVAAPILIVVLLPDLAIALSDAFLLGLIALVPAYVLLREVTAWTLGETSLRESLVRRLAPSGVDLLSGGTIQRVPITTIGLIVVNTLVFLELESEPLAFVYSEPALWPATNVSSMFAHIDAAHLTGNMLFLWIFGAPLEGRIGAAPMLIWYLAAGTAANLLEFGIEFCSPSGISSSVGASGAISGVMGVFLVRCHFSRVSVGITALGPIAPGLLAFRVRVPAPVLVTMFFLMDLSGARESITHPVGIGYWAHVGGFLFGIWLGFTRGLLRNAYRDELSEQCETPHCGEASEVRRTLLELEPDHVPAIVAQAREEVDFGRMAEAQRLYRRGVELLLPCDRPRAAELFVESFGRRADPLPLAEQLALTPFLVRLGSRDVAARALELARRADRSDRALVSRAALAEARLLVELSLHDVAEQVLRELVAEDPASAEAGLARERLTKLEEP